jgi:histidinol phosphatase-like PHP family hydrolase
MLKNSGIAELLARESEDASRFVQKALRRAARLSFIWPEEAAALLAEKRSLTEFPGVGPHLERIIRGWIESTPPIPKNPPIRSDFITLPEARAVLAKKRDLAKQLRGDLQMHTEWSDGSGTVRQMADEALVRGYEYIAITDHTQGLKIAGGIDESELRQQGKEIKAVNSELADSAKQLTVLRSTEMNLNTRGEGDMDSAALAELDIVLGSFHSALRGKEDQTERYLSALRNPDIQILGHPRGRIYNYRDGLNADWQRVFAEAAALDKAVEIDAYPDRQDLSVKLLKLARAAGCRVSIGTDAHHPHQLGFIELGLAAAALARISAERIINFYSREDLLAWVASVRVRSALKPSRPRRKSLTVKKERLTRAPDEILKAL